MSKFLITGGAGFIGSNLATRLIDDGHQVTVIDDLSMGLEKNLPQTKALRFIEHDVCDKLFMESLLVKECYDYIFHLAAIASVADSIARPIETHQVNQESTLNLLEIIRKNKLVIKKFIFSSSAAVYGDEPSLPKSEESAIRPLTPYAIDKFSSERFCSAYATLYGIPTTMTRFFNVYGPKQNPASPYSGVLSILTEAFKKKQEFLLFGDGEQTRDFVYINDVVEALLLLAESEESIGQVYNVGANQTTSVNEIIQIFEEKTGQHLKIKHLKARDGDIRNSAANISKITKLGFQPRFNVNHGLNQYLDYEKL